MVTNMKTSDFSFELPENLIAQFPSEERGRSRLMTLDRVTGKRVHRMVDELPEILCGQRFLSPSGEKPLLVFNNTKVRKARLIGKSLESGAEVEFLLLDKIKNDELGIGDLEWRALVQRAKRRKAGSWYVFFDSAGKETARAQIIRAEGEFRFLRFENCIDDEFLDRYGHVPLPPYIKRKDVSADSQRYQTVYARQIGSAAAPTAGLHFTRELLDKIAANGMESVFVTLHVGLGTFLPVRSGEIKDHVMHNESFFIEKPAAEKIETAKKEGRKIIAVGTTSVRTLESAWDGNNLKTGEGSTSIFIYPPFDFKVVDAIFTNFHTPESTLLMLISAFATRELVLESYAEAVKEQYRFFSYGDAMLIS